ncbi:MAG: class I SAM-dependent methyltransferase, partial [Planctomycetota bacterium]
AWDQEILAEIGPECSSLRILDIGCATGRLLCRLAEAGVGRLCGTDLAPNILEAARRKLARHDAEVELKPADAEDALPWPDGSFDVVVLSGVFHHFYRPLDALAEVHRLLAPGGRIIVVEPAFPPIIRQILNGYMFLFPHDGDCSFRSPGGIAALLRSARFGRIRSRRIPRFSYLVVGGKTIPLTGSA